MCETILKAVLVVAALIVTVILALSIYRADKLPPDLGGYQPAVHDETHTQPPGNE